MQPLEAAVFATIFPNLNPNPERLTHSFSGVCAFRSTKIMRIIVLALVSAVNLTGCMRHSLPDAKIASELLNGVSPDNLKDFHYAYEGNQAGYIFLARFSASEVDIEKLVRGAADWGRQTPSYSLEGGSIPRLLTARLGKYYELDENQEVHVWRRTGYNRMTSSFIHFVYLLPDNETVYFYGSGI